MSYALTLKVCNLKRKAIPLGLLQIESFRSRLAAVSREKYENEHKVIQLSDELEKKSKQSRELRHKNGQLQMSVAELDRVAQEQLHALADQSHAAISATQSKLLQANSTAQHLTQFVKVLISGLFHLKR